MQFLAYVCTRGDVALATALIDLGVPITSPHRYPFDDFNMDDDDRDRDPVYAACAAGQVAVLQLLLRRGAKVTDTLRVLIWVLMVWSDFFFVLPTFFFVLTFFVFVPDFDFQMGYVEI